MKASLSIYGLYVYDNSVFDNLVLPSGMEDHRQELIMEIIFECSDFALLYPDWDMMKMLIGVWSKNELRIWEKMYQSETIEFNPIENYDRHEALTRSVNSSSRENSNELRARNGASERGRTGSNTGINVSKSENSETNEGYTQDSNVGNNEAISSKTAYDTNTMKDVSKTSTSNNGTTSSMSSESKTGSGGTTVNDASNSTENENLNNSEQESSAGNRNANNRGLETVVNHVHGNIGVTTAAQMLEGFRNISNFCTVRFILDSFKDRFCVQVY